MRRLRVKRKLLDLLIAVLLLTIVFSGCFEETKEPMGNNKTHIEIATDFMNTLQQKKYDISYTYFNNEMKNSLKGVFGSNVFYVYANFRISCYFIIRNHRPEG